MPFEVFREARSALPEVQPQVTILTNGVLTLNRSAVEALGSPQVVELLYDRDEQIIGLRPTDPSEPHARPLRSPTKASTRQVSIHLFAKHYGIDLSTSRRYPAELRGDVLTIDLKGDSVVVTRRRGQALEVVE